MDDLARKIHGKRQSCSVHGTDSMAYDILEGRWRCLGDGEHEHTGRDRKDYPDNMLADMKRLGIDPRGKPKMSNGGSNRGRTHVSTYTNGKGDRRMQISMSLDTARKIAAGDSEAFDKVVAAVTDAAQTENARTDGK
jgi:hypothetical protein